VASLNRILPQYHSLIYSPTEKREKKVGKKEKEKDIITLQARAVFNASYVRPASFEAFSTSLTNPETKAEDECERMAYLVYYQGLVLT